MSLHCHYIANFNPRLRVGGDMMDLLRAILHFNFNPRLRVGGDNREVGVCFFKINFNPRLRVGGDQTLFRLSRCHQISIHASV